MTKIGIIGTGKWGMNHVKTLHNNFPENFFAVCDKNKNTLEKINFLSDNVLKTDDIDFIINSGEVDGLIIATPAETHFEIAKKALQNNKHVLVEKPLTLYSEETAELIELSEKNNKVLMVGHVLLYHPAIIKIKQMIKDGHIGKVQYIYSNRLNLGTIRSEENILWSFAPHDISVIQYLIESNPLEVEAMGAVFLQHNIEDSTLTYLLYPNNIHAHIYVSWLHPFKEQRLVIIGDKGMITFEDSLPSEKLKLYEKGFIRVENELHKFDKDYRVVDFENSPPLMEEQKHFIDCIENKTKCKTDGKHAFEVLKILELAHQKLKQ